MKKKPVTGMKDILPGEAEIRAYVTAMAREVYSGFGFCDMETPCVEHLENLLSNQGGENEKLIFKIMKRGEKLEEAAAAGGELADCGLRYDLTLPLSRYFSNNQANLPVPFKAFQMGYVFRADRPQKGRFRQFMQCDIDILGDATYLAEVELITATTTLLGKLGFEDFKVRINDRRMLRAMAACSGIEGEGIFITLDKMDKIGAEGVRTELIESGCDEGGVDRYMSLFDGISGSVSDIEALAQKVSEHLPEGCAEDLVRIISLVSLSKPAKFEVVFDPTLVRGMGYYTGPIFEIEMPQFGSSVAGGGRYDEMIGRFTGQQTPAVGFSIGFERIITILLDEGFKVPGSEGKVALLLEKGLSEEKCAEAMKKAAQLRAEGRRVLLTWANKNKKFQKEQLAAQGYEEFIEYYAKEFKN